MWPLKKKKIEKKFKKIKVIKYKDPVNFQVGYTVVNLKFLDGREFQTIVYGTVEQYTGMYYDRVDGVGQIFINNSDIIAKNFIKNTCYSEKTFLDDPNCPKKSINGTAISAEIDSTEENFSIEFKDWIFKLVKNQLKNNPELYFNIEKNNE